MPSPLSHPIPPESPGGTCGFMPWSPLGVSVVLSGASPDPCPLGRAVPGQTAAVMGSEMVRTDPGFHNPGAVSRGKVASVVRKEKALLLLPAQQVQDRSWLLMDFPAVVRSTRCWRGGRGSPCSSPRLGLLQLRGGENGGYRGCWPCHRLPGAIACPRGFGEGSACLSGSYWP